MEDTRMKLISVNVGKARLIENAGKSGKTGIYKTPVKGPVSVAARGIPGDAVLDKKNHGGADQAIYIYCQPDYEWWTHEMGREMLPGTLGENLTLSGPESTAFSIGDRLLVGNVILQVTSPRMPCKTLAARMEDPDFMERYRKAERPGLYCRVLQEGEVESGQAVRLESYEGKTVTILEMFRDFYVPDRTEAAIRRYLEAPISIRARQDKEKQLQGLVG